MKTIEVQAFIDKQKFSAYQWMIMVLCFLVVAADGFDTAAIGFVAPSLLDSWHISRAALGPVMSAALVGLGIGALVSGPIADRIGRKRVLVLSVFFFGVWSLASAHAQSVQSLTVLRFLTGLGLGAAMPNAVTLMSEYAPQKIRAVVINTMFCGFSVGLSIGGISAAWLIPNFGWSSVLTVGGVGPIVLAAVLWTAIPESAQFMVVRRRSEESIAKILRRIAPNANFDDCRFVAADSRGDIARKSSISIILSKPYTLATLMLWLAYFMGLVIYYLLTNWLPTIFRDTGLDIRHAALMTSLFPVGGVLGNVCLGWVMDRFKPRRAIALTYLLAGVLVFAIGHHLGGSAALGLLIFFTGTAVTAAVTSMSALAAGLYPTASRATGVSWMLGIGRMGAVVGALAGAVLMSMNLPFGAVFSLLAVPAVAAALALALMGRMGGTGPIRSESMKIPSRLEQLDS